MAKYQGQPLPSERKIGPIVSSMRYGDPYTLCIDRRTPWGNPFRITPKCDRKTACENHRQWLLAWIREKRHIRIGRYSNKWVVENAHKLRGNILGCWCKPAQCHGDNLVELAEGRLK